MIKGMVMAGCRVLTAEHLEYVRRFEMPYVASTLGKLPNARNFMESATVRLRLPIHARNYPTFIGAILLTSDTSFNESGARFNRDRLSSKSCKINQSLNPRDPPDSRKELLA